MLTFNEISNLKLNPLKLTAFLEQNNVGLIKFLLMRFGKIPEEFDKKPLLSLLNNKNSKVRSLAIKNLAKVKDSSLIEEYSHIIKTDKSTEVRREAVSALGRLHDESTIPILMSLLEDRDPEIVMQSIRGLLVFKNVPAIKSKLKSLDTHQNEIIRGVIKKEFYNQNGKKEKNHAKSPNDMKNVVVQGNVLNILKEIPDNSIHLTFTSPPYYNARDYSIYQSYEEYLHFLENVFREVYRITKEGRFFILNTSPIIIPRFSRQHSSKRYPIPYDIHPLLIKMGWEFIDDIVWVKPEASVKNRNGGFLQHRKPLAYKPNARTEQVMVYRKRSDELIDWNIRQYAHSVVNDSRVNGEYLTNNVWEIDPVFDKTHSAVFPKELCDNIIRYYSFVGDLVFDPFAGSGTFGKSALSLNRFFFLTEINEEYIRRIKENLSVDIPLTKNYKKPMFLSADLFKSSIK